MSLKKKKAGLCALLAVLEALLFLRDYGGYVNSYNSSLLAISYEYGFTSRGLSGTIFYFLNKILPFDLMNYNGVLRYSQLVTALFMLVVWLFCFYVIHKADEKNYQHIQITTILLVVFSITFFANSYNFGRVDIYLVGIAIVCVLILLWKKLEWLVIPLSCFAVMFHQAYVFMFFNVTLVILIYRFLEAKNKNKIKYIVIFILSFMGASALFLYFNFFAHTTDIGVYNKVVDVATAISKESEGYHEALLQHEILGIDPTTSEWEYHLKNFVEFPIFALFMVPYIVLIIRIFTNIIKKADEKVSKYKYIIMAIGVLTILPNLILKVDYGRWVFSIIVYYILVFTFLIANNDKLFLDVLDAEMLSIKTKPYVFLLYVLPLLVTPMWDVNICMVSAHLGGDLNNSFLHLWVD